MKELRGRILWWALKRRIRIDQPKVIAVTGSFAKTSTKEAIRCVLEQGARQRVTTSWGNLNTYLGVPLGVFGFEIDFYQQKITWEWLFILIRAVIRSFTKRLGQYLLVELGVDKVGDMGQFVKEIKLDIAVITRLGEAHLVNFPSIEDYWKEKAAIALGLKDNGILLVNEADKIILPKGVSCKIKIEKFSCEDKTIYLTVARTVGRLLGLSESIIEDSLSKFSPPSGRMTIYQNEKYIMMDDSYNANPQSMVSALEWLSESEKQRRKVAILGDMLELGEKEVDYHRSIGKLARENANLVIAVGPLAKNYLFDYYFLNAEEAAQKVIALIKEGDKILVKGSHGVKMGLIAEVIRNEFF